MAAEVTLRRWTGAAGSPIKTDVTQVNNRHRTDDVVSAAGVGSAVPVPPSGEMRYSFWQSYRLRVDGGTFSAVSDLLMWPDGADGFPTGVTTVCAIASDYAEATGTVGETGLELSMANHPFLVAAPVDIFSFSSATPIDLGGMTVSAPTDVGQFLVVQVQVDPLASTGVATAETLSFGWNEI